MRKYSSDKDCEIALLGIRDGISNFHDVDPQHLYELVGRNTGNLMFTHAVTKQLKGTISRIGYAFDPSEVNEKYDIVVIPAANWLGEYVDMGFLADLVEKLTVPCVIVGLGAQSDLEGRIPVLAEGSIRLITAISDRSESLSIRGPFTAKVLDFYGFSNYTVTGCPSIFMDLERTKEVRKPLVAKLNKIAISSTRYYLEESLFSTSGSNAGNWLLFKTAYNLKTDIIYQSEIPEFEFILRMTDWTDNGVSRDSYGNINLEQLVRTYGATKYPDVFQYIRTHGKLFFSVRDWISAMKNYDFFIGTRVHGTIAALLAGIPALLVQHDSRTKEIAQFCGIPTCRFDFSKDQLEASDILELYRELDLTSFTSKSKLNYEILKKFYELNNVPTKL